MLPIWVPVIGWGDYYSLPKVIILVQIYGSCFWLLTYGHHLPFLFFFACYLHLLSFPQTFLFDFFSMQRPLADCRANGTY